MLKPRPRLRASLAAPLPTQLPEPLRLPRGSVRGGIAVLVTATYGYLLILGPTVPTVVVNAVVVVVAFYFGSHATATPPRAPTAPPPPHRPRLVRALLLLGFLGLAGWFLWHNPTPSGISSALTGYICYALATNQVSAFAGKAEDALSLVVTFYFGSRVIGH